MDRNYLRKAADLRSKSLILKPFNQEQNLFKILLVQLPGFGKSVQFSLYYCKLFDKKQPNKGLGALRLAGIKGRFSACF